MPQHLTILTGASRGMGLAMAEQLLVNDAVLVCISRQTHTQLAEQAQRVGATLLQWPLDLADGASACAQLGQWLRQQDPATLASATLINNAGVIPPLVPLSESDPAALAQALRVGLEAPMQLTATFLGATRQWSIPRKVLNISSGLGRRAMASQAAYCAAKAGMDHFTRCVALDEALQANGAKVCSLAPGVIDTDMQRQLRSADATQFPDHGSFAGLHAQGQLTSPADAARRVLAYLARADFGKDAVGDVRG
ncbi:SDR family NAD(P)-dependent oxidoreductase [Rhodoferax sp.]|uniref:SDR family NAD(P)-dependent oxidoreductase n=1 Tax=Rhodoferax sp. TaxID=50421 RepID=UPI002ACEF846|nr:SDR family NAD(P)-dependent oxidoreductase [Rhodoferax sp.]MDZ7919733.1 SDR family NAD(P)-dependent oxidoreductase [Rhodoferax sp.]